jgi:sterol desaturase/sphingolipid hydroxylase (fatty acid hydroxylase superfamily)/creatinine amidohydrolase/Fe(II)-dependent formamide hydrolase-like protein
VERVLEYLFNRISDPFLAIITPGHRIYWLYLCASLAIALVAFCLGDERGTAFSVKRFLRFLAPKAIFLHRSALLDYRYFIVNRIAFGLLLFPVVTALSLATVSVVGELLYEYLGFPPFELSQGIGSIVLLTLLSALAMDFGLFLAHYLQHRIPMLWEFHKVHHSAQVLTPVTAYRMHPVDDLFSMSMAGLLAGSVQGAFNFLQPENAGPAIVLGLNGVLFAFYVLGYNLRHSHIWVSYGPLLSRILISPAQHQIHHSKASRHLDKNFGFIFAFWDQWFGSLYVPRTKENIEIGLANLEDEEYSTIRRLYFLPFAKALSNRVRAASAAVLGLVMIFVCAQSVMVVHAALTRGAADGSGLRRAGTAPPPEVAEVASGMKSVFLENLTWVEVRALLEKGTTVAIVPTGGTEQNGYHVILGKHNYIVRHTAGEIARRLGNALVTPVIAYVPEGDIAPPSGHMRYAGTLSLPEAVFESLLEHTARSLRAHGFKVICLLGDSGGNQRSQQRVAQRLNRQWRSSGVRVLHVGDYYFKNGQIDWLKNDGETAASIGTHAGIRDTSELLYVYPEGVRGSWLHSSPSFASTGADGDPAKASTARGESLVNLKINAAVREIREGLAQIAASPAIFRLRPETYAISP